MQITAMGDPSAAGTGNALWTRCGRERSGTGGGLGHTPCNDTVVFPQVSGMIGDL